VVVGEVLVEHAAEVTVVEDDHVVMALAPNRADHALRERVLPGRAGSGEHLLDAEVLQSAYHLVAVDPITVTDEEAGSGVPGEGLAELLCGPLPGSNRGPPNLREFVCTGSCPRHHLKRQIPHISRKRREVGGASVLRRRDLHPREERLHEHLPLVTEGVRRDVRLDGGPGGSTARAICPTARPYTSMTPTLMSMTLADRLEH